MESCDGPHGSDEHYSSFFVVLALLGSVKILFTGCFFVALEYVSSAYGAEKNHPTPASPKQSNSNCS